MPAQGLKFGQAARDYERGRPGWPEAALDHLDLPPTSDVLDLAAGTGKLTRLLVGRFRHVTAVEPLEELRTLLTANIPGIDVRDGVAERVPLDDSSVDAVFVAEAFHWFDPAAAFAEVKRVLRRGGLLALLWNIPDGPWEPALPEAARDLVRAATARGGEPGGPRLARGEWREPFAESLEHEEFEHVHGLDRDGLVANTLSVSSLAGLPAGERHELREQLTRLLPQATYRRRLRAHLYSVRL